MNEDGQKILLPEPTLRRLPWYLAYVNMLRTQKIEYVSSTQISRKINVDASQIAKDLSFLNIKEKHASAIRLRRSPPNCQISSDSTTTTPLS